MNKEIKKGGVRNPYTEERTRIITSFANAGGGHIFIHWLRNELMQYLDYFSSSAIYVDNVEMRLKIDSTTSPDMRGREYVLTTYDETEDPEKYKAHKAIKDNLKLMEAQKKLIDLKNKTNSKINLLLGKTGKLSSEVSFRNYLNPNSSKGIETNGRYVPIGALHREWDVLWKKALNESKVALIIQNGLYNYSNGNLAGYIDNNSNKEVDGEISLIRERYLSARLKGFNYKIIVIKFDDEDIDTIDLKGKKNSIKTYETIKKNLNLKIGESRHTKDIKDIENSIDLMHEEVIPKTVIKCKRFDQTGLLAHLRTDVSSVYDQDHKKVYLGWRDKTEEDRKDTIAAGWMISNDDVFKLALTLKSFGV